MTSPEPPAPSATLPLVFAALFASGALFFAGTGLHPVWWLTWFAPLPVLLVVTRLRPGRAYLVAAGSWLIGGLNLWHYLHDTIKLPLAVPLLAIGLPACVFGAVVLLYRWLIRRGLTGTAIVAFPAAWSTYEYVSSLVSPHGTFGAIAYSQMDCLPVLQLASLTGIWGIGFCLFAFPATVTALVIMRGGRRAVMQSAAVGGALALVLVLIYGWWRLATEPDGRLVTIGLIASDLRENRFPETDETSLRLFRDYVDRISALAERADREAPPNADRVIVLPEKIGVLSDPFMAEFDQLFQSAATRSRAIIVAGVDRGTSAARHNEARISGFDAPDLGSYDKHHLIPGLEDVDEAGAARLLIARPSGTWGVEICKDMDFPPLSREYARDRIALLLVPAWDFDVDGWLHGRMAVMRGVEGGFAIARSAKQGRLMVTDSRGRILAEQGSDTAPFSLLVSTIRVSHADTLYAWAGDWFAWLTAAMLLVVLGRAARGRSASPASPRGDERD